MIKLTSNVCNTICNKFTCGITLKRILCWKHAKCHLRDIFKQDSGTKCTFGVYIWLLYVCTKLLIQMNSHNNSGLIINAYIRKPILPQEISHQNFYTPNSTATMSSFTIQIKKGQEKRFISKHAYRLCSSSERLSF